MYTESCFTCRDICGSVMPEEKSEAIQADILMGRCGGVGAVNVRKFEEIYTFKKLTME